MTDTPDLLAALAASIDRARLDPPPTVRHPGTGCPCDDCTRRDDALESLAEARAEARRGY